MQIELPESRNFADFPGAADCVNVPMTAADLGPHSHGNVLISNGVEWYPQGGVAVLALSQDITTTEYDEAAQVAYAYAIPANLVGAVGEVRLEFDGLATLDGADKFDFELQLDGDAAITLATHLEGSISGVVRVYANGKYSYVMHREDGNVTAGIGTHTLDFTAENAMTLNVTLKNEGDTFDLISTVVTLVK